MITESDPTLHERERMVRRSSWFGVAYAILGLAYLAIGFERASWSLSNLSRGEWEIGLGLCWIFLAGVYLARAKRTARRG